MEPRESSRSIRRFVELLELFEQLQRPLSSAEIAEALVAPRSSVATLLRSLVDLGVLISDRRTATYMPSTHLADLTSWVVRSWIPDNSFLERLAALRSETQETISLWTAVNLQMEVLHAIEGESPLSLRLRAGQRFPMLFSAVGAAYLVSLPMTTRAALLRRIENDARAHRNVTDILRFRGVIKIARQRGHALAESALVPDVAAIAVSFSGPGQARPLVVSVGGLASRIVAQESRIARALQRFVVGG